MNQNPTNKCLVKINSWRSEHRGNDWTNRDIRAVKRAVMWSDEATMINSVQCTTVVKESEENTKRSVSLYFCYIDRLLLQTLKTRTLLKCCVDVKRPFFMYKGFNL